jgi:hypothetical protein
MELADFVHDPLGFVHVQFPVGRRGIGSQKPGRAIFSAFLIELGATLQNPETRISPSVRPFSSGHGIGKSALTWLGGELGLSTFEDTKVIIMAGTGDQLKTKTQPEVSNGSV